MQILTNWLINWFLCKTMYITYMFNLSVSRINIIELGTLHPLTDQNSSQQYNINVNEQHNSIDKMEIMMGFIHIYVMHIYNLNVLFSFFGFVDYIMRRKAGHTRRGQNNAKRTKTNKSGSIIFMDISFFFNFFVFPVSVYFCAKLHFFFVLFVDL
jgi:hypothetical protein